MNVAKLFFSIWIAQICLLDSEVSSTKDEDFISKLVYTLKADKNEIKDLYNFISENSEIIEKYLANFLEAFVVSVAERSTDDTSEYDDPMIISVYRQPNDNKTEEDFLNEMETVFRIIREGYHKIRSTPTIKSISVCHDQIRGSVEGNIKAKTNVWSKGSASDEIIKNGLFMFKCTSTNPDEYKQSPETIELAAAPNSENEQYAEMIILVETRSYGWVSVFEMYNKRVVEAHDDVKEGLLERLLERLETAFGEKQVDERRLEEVLLETTGEKEKSKIGLPLILTYYLALSKGKI